MPSTIVQPSSYRLANHVRACRIDEQVVLLDMQRNKYLGLGGSQLTTLSQVIVDWPARPADRKATLSSARIDVFLKTLLDQRMLADASSRAQPNAVLEDPRDSFSVGLDRTRPSPAWRDMLDLARAGSVAALWLKWRCLADVASSIRRLRPPTTSSVDTSTSAQLHAATSAYMRLRPLLFTAHDQCLYDSLALVRFLAIKGFFPSWVIGVRIRPFTAHSWVQHEGLVLNDIHEHVRDYTPLLVV